MSLWEWFTGGRDRVNEDSSYEVEPTTAYDEGCVAGAHYEAHGGPKPRNPYRYSPEKEEWQYGFDISCGDN